MRSNLRLPVLILGVCSASLAIAGATSAQAPAVYQGRQNFETREALEAQAKLADAKQQKSASWLIRSRLEHGDFQPGDRIIVRVKGSVGFSDTLPVRAGKLLQLPQMGDFPLDGVLRSELVPKLSAHVGKYLRNPQVEATQLVRVGVLGNVIRPGFYYSPADVPLSDVLMLAGGTNPDADLGKISVSREGQVVIDQQNMRVALSEGVSLDLLNMQAGDEITVGKQRHFNWPVVVPTVTGVLGLLIALSQIHH
ncbi:MAG: SLBB domain-containing protein [Gemmatimonadota bacterium]|nr:SLBB domain-containing protein [Gemmatimonadota bacterium]